MRGVRLRVRVRGGCGIRLRLAGLGRHGADPRGLPRPRAGRP
jgi:hypothetical protein